MTYRLNGVIIRNLTRIKLFHFQFTSATANNFQRNFRKVEYSYQYVLE